jgi:hypothetical protein
MNKQQTTLAIIGAIAVVTVFLFGWPQYKVWQQRKEGQAMLAHAQYAKEVAVAEAKAKKESAALLSEADTLRAHGTARANEIIGKSITKEYLQWFWTESLKENQGREQVIYVPSGQLGVPIMEAGRLGVADTGFR